MNACHIYCICHIEGVKWLGGVERVLVTGSRLRADHSSGRHEAGESAGDGWVS